MARTAARLPSARTSAEDKAAAADGAVVTEDRSYADVRRLLDLSRRYSFADRGTGQSIFAASERRNGQA